MSKHLDLATLELKSGGHDPDGEMCLMEAVAYFAHEPWSDHPKCASKVIGAFGRALNDRMNDTDRQLLKPFIPRIVGTNTGAADEKVRAYLAVDWSVHTFSPAWLEKLGMTDEAAILRALPIIDSAAAAHAATPIIKGVRDAAWKRRSDARAKLERSYADAADAAAAYAADAAYAAAAYAADAAAAYAAYAAYAAAAYAAYAAAAYAAEQLKGMTYEEKVAFFRKRIDETLGDTIREMQLSALDLLDRMIAVGARELVTS